MVATVKVQSRGAVLEGSARVRAGGEPHRRPSWLQQRAPGLSTRQRPQWRERLWACLTVLMVIAGWDVSSRLDEPSPGVVLEARRPAA